MNLKSMNPCTPSMRGLVRLHRSILWKGRPEKSLTSRSKICGARNNNGHITVRARGGGHKRLLRKIDFLRDKLDVKGAVERIEYDPNRSSFIALIKYEDGDKRYIIAPSGLVAGDVVLSGESSPIRTGNTMSLSKIPDGSLVHNIEITPNRGGQIARTAGNFGQVVGRESEYVIIRLPSGEVRKFYSKCRATIGGLSNGDRKNLTFGKAGRSRWLGIRPTVRGVAMNPVDHPHGGGEGKTSGGRHPVTPWGVGTKGKKTVKVHRSLNLIVRSRRKK